MIKTKISELNSEISSKLVKQDNALLFRILGICCRILFGIVFLFSGFVKAIDPLGTTYKMLDYFQAMGLPQPYTLTLIISISMIAIEFAIGLSLITGINSKLFAWIGLLFMLVMTPITLWLAVTNAVSDCGCFGDALKLTNWETFGKNIILLIITIAILYFEKYTKNYLSKISSWIISTIFFIISISISTYCLHNLPLIDFLPYKIGNNISEQMKVPDDKPKDIYSTTFIYKNKISGESKAFNSLADAPWNDSINWEYVSQTTELIQKGYEPPIHDFMIFNPEIGDVTYNILSDNNFVFIFVMYDLSLTDEKTIDDLNNIYITITEKGYRSFALTASTEVEIDRFAQTKNTLFPFYTADAIPLKTMVRANPGVIILKNGTVIDKWNAKNTVNHFESFLQNNILSNR